MFIVRDENNNIVFKTNKYHIAFAVFNDFPQTYKKEWVTYDKK